MYKISEKYYKGKKFIFSKTPRTFFRKSKYPQTIKKLNIFRLIKNRSEYQYSKLYRKDKIANNILTITKQSLFYYKTHWTKNFKKRFTGRWFSNNEAFIVSKLKNSKIILQWWRNWKIKFFFKRKKSNYLQLRWEKTFYILNNKIHVRRKTKNKKYYEKLFRKYKKKNMILNKININKSFLQTQGFPFYFIVKRNLSQLLLKKYKIKTNSIKFWSILRAYKITVLEKPKTKIFSFVMQRRNHNAGFSHWEKYTIKWLKFSLLKNKAIRFYFSPIRIKKILLSKKLKYIKIYKRLKILHPRAGKWATIGLVGNSFANNTAFIKIKILTKIMLHFYAKTKIKIIRKMRQTIARKNSKYDTKIAFFFTFFEKRIDIALFRTGLVIDIELSRLLISRGYFQQNYIIRRNIHSRIAINDFLNLFHCFRNVIYTNLESVYENRTYETFHKVFLTRFYKKPKNNIFYFYFTTIINSLTQMIGKPFWTKSYSATWTFLNKYKIWLPIVSTKILYELQLNLLLTTVNRFDKDANIKYTKPLNWAWFKKEENLLNVKKTINFKQFYIKKKTLRKNYISKIFKIIHQQIQQKNRQKKTDIFFLKPIIKDIVTQTGEKFVNNLLVNFKYRYAVFAEKFEIKRNFLTETGEENGRVVFFQFRWLINFT